MREHCSTPIVVPESDFYAIFIPPDHFVSSGVVEFEVLDPQAAYFPE